MKTVVVLSIILILNGCASFGNKSNGISEAIFEESEILIPGNTIGFGSIIPGFWYNGRYEKLNFGSQTVSSFLNNQDVYVVGNKIGFGSIQPCMWKNGQYSELEKGTETMGVFAVNNDVYVIGNKIGFGSIQPCIWIDGVYFELPNGTEVSSYHNIKKQRQTVAKRSN